MKITKEYLESLGACQEHIDLFVETFPEGAEISKENVVLAQMASLDIAWFLSEGGVEVAKILLENGADVHAESDHALRWASRNGRLEVVKILLENGADVHARNDEALRRASEEGHAEVVGILLEAGS